MKNVYVSEILKLDTFFIRNFNLGVECIYSKDYKYYNFNNIMYRYISENYDIKNTFNYTNLNLYPDILFFKKENNLYREVITGKYFYSFSDIDYSYYINELNDFKTFILFDNAIKKLDKSLGKEELKFYKNKLVYYLKYKDVILDVIIHLNRYENKCLNLIRRRYTC